MLPKIIDSHQHFWMYDATKHSWIDEEMASIRKNFLPQDLEPILNENNISGCVAVQADQTEIETEFLVSLSENNKFIKGVVGWVDLNSPDVSKRLDYFSTKQIIKGFRHVLQGEDPSFMLKDSFLKGIGLLSNYNYTYDILIFPKHLKAAYDLANQFPEQKFVIDHIAKPDIKNSSNLKEWEIGLKKIASLKNVFCKLSGMVTEADYHAWKEDQIIPFIKFVTELFGTDRLMYGSDWPVCEVAANYQTVFNLTYNFFASQGEDVLEKVFSTNAIQFYNLY